MSKRTRACVTRSNNLKSHCGSPQKNAHLDLMSVDFEQFAGGSNFTHVQPPPTAENATFSGGKPYPIRETGHGMLILTALIPLAGGRD